MKPVVQESKARLRQECLERRLSIRPEQVAARSGAILQRLVALREYAEAELVHTYVASVDNEVETDGLIRLALEEGKRVAVPVVEPGCRVLRHAEIRDLGELRTGHWGLRQPPAERARWLEDAAAIDLVIVPGLAFDLRGHRLGFGGGYYDRFLSGVSATTVGLTFACLLLEAVPLDPWDVPVDLVVTESTLQRGEEA